MMIITTGTKRMWPVSGVGPLTEEYSMVSDWNDEWLTGGTEGEVISDAKLDEKSILEGITRFANARPERLARQKALLID